MSGQLLSQPLVSSVDETTVYLRLASGHSAIGRRWRRGARQLCRSFIAVVAQRTRSGFGLASDGERAAAGREGCSGSSCVLTEKCWPRMVLPRAPHVQPAWTVRRGDSAPQRWRPPGFDAVGQRDTEDVRRTMRKNTDLCRRLATFAG